MADFLACENKYKNGPIAMPIEGYTLAPWVRILFTNGGAEISVGNRSSTDGNTAVIKDFEFAGSDGIKVRVNIHDQQGGSFAKFMEDLVKDAKCLESGAVHMEFEWGWVRTDCPGNMPVVKSPVHYALPMDVECNFSGGKFMFQILATDMGTRMLEGKIKETEGDDANPICFQDALRSIFVDGCGPKISVVDFINKDGDPGICWKVKDCGQCEGGSEKGARDVWNHQNRDKLQAAYEMLRKPEGLTVNDRSCVLMYDSTTPTGRIVVQEVKKPNPGEGNAWEGLSIGKTYIVNGSKRSPVIEFNPRIRWSFHGLQATSGGEASGARPLQNDDGGESPGDDRSRTLVKPYIKCIGSEISSAPNRATENREGERAEEETTQSQTQHEKGLQLTHDNVEADLVIIGDPTLPPPLELMQRVCGIIFINPFHIRATGGVCGEWLAPPTCNEILSNKAWIIKHVTHKISPGSYQTVLRVLLTASGVDIECNDPLGGIGSNGWQPKCCN